MSSLPFGSNYIVKILIYSLIKKYAHFDWQFTEKKQELFYYITELMQNFSFIEQVFFTI